MSVVIGVDPHKASHTAVAVNEQELPLGNLRVRSSAVQLDRLLEWAAPWPQRTWAVENAAGLGYLLAQQLIGAGERVVDVQPKLAARVRLLGAAAVNKNDPNDARSIAVVALRNPGLTALSSTDHVEVIRIWVRRRRELGNHRTRVVNQLHTVLGELIAGGFDRMLSARQADALLDAFTPVGPVAAARLEVARGLIADVRRLDEQLREVDKRLRAEVGMTGTSLTNIFGVGPVVAAMVLAMTGDVRRFASADRFAAYAGTAPIEVSSGPHQVFRLSRPGNRHLNYAVQLVAVTQISHRDSIGRTYYDRKLAEGQSPKMALRSLKRQITTALYRAMVNDTRRPRREGNPGGQPGHDSDSSATGSHPDTGSSDKSLPGPRSA